MDADTIWRRLEVAGMDPTCCTSTSAHSEPACLTQVVYDSNISGKMCASLPGPAYPTWLVAGSGTLEVVTVDECWRDSKWHSSTGRLLPWRVDPVKLLMNSALPVGAVDLLLHSV